MEVLVSDQSPQTRLRASIRLHLTTRLLALKDQPIYVENIKIIPFK